MSQYKNVLKTLSEMVNTVNAPVPVHCRMLPDGTIIDRNTGERYSQIEANRRYLVMALLSISIPALEQPVIKDKKPEAEIIQ